MSDLLIHPNPAVIARIPTHRVDGASLDRAAYTEVYGIVRSPYKSGSLGIQFFSKVSFMAACDWLRRTGMKIGKELIGKFPSPSTKPAKKKPSPKKPPKTTTAKRSTTPCKPLGISLADAKPVSEIPCWATTTRPGHVPCLFHVSVFLDPVAIVTNLRAHEWFWQDLVRAKELL